MGTLSPLFADAFRLLRDDLYGHLDDAEFLTTKCDEWSDQDIDTAGELIVALVTVVRGLLIEHEPQTSGECRICRSVFPCQVVTAIHGLLKDPEQEYIEMVRRARARSLDADRTQLLP
ncbi:MAG: hypothetical protein ACT4NY_28795 [Pseudonocardiales bacterium]